MDGNFLSTGVRLCCTVIRLLYLDAYLCLNGLGGVSRGRALQKELRSCGCISQCGVRLVIAGPFHHRDCHVVESNGGFALQEHEKGKEGTRRLFSRAHFRFKFNMRWVL